MGCGTCLLVTLRLFQVLTAVTVIALGAWVNHMAEDARQNGDQILDTLFSDPQKEKPWKDFFDSLLQTPKRVWFAIVAGSWTLLAVIFLALARRLRLNISRWIFISLEFLTMILMACAFAAVASLAIELEPLCFALDFVSPELIAFFKVCPVSKAYSVAAGFSWVLFVLTTITVLVENCCKRRKQKVVTFEPTASALGMGHEYQAVPLATVQSSLPPMDDSYVNKDGLKEQEVGIVVTVEQDTESRPRDSSGGDGRRVRS